MSFGLQPPYENVGTTQPPIEQGQKTAANELAKFTLGLTPDTLNNQTFADVDRQNTWKYNSNTPFLVKPALGNFRGLAEEFNSPEELLSAILTLLQKAGISEETLDKLAEMTRLSPEERNPTGFPGYEIFYAFAEVMKDAARFNIGCTTAEAGAASESSFNEAYLNGQIPDVVSANIGQVGNEYLAEAGDLLIEFGANYLGFDAASADLNDFRGVVNG